MTYLRLPSSWAFRGVFALTILALAVGASLAFAAQSEASDDTCSNLPSHDALKQALGEARHDTDGNGGFDLDMWGTVVNRDGVVCEVAFTGQDRGDRGGNAQAAREALIQVQSAVIGTGTPGTVSYLIWDGQALSMAATAWVEYAEGDFERAVTTMEAAAERSSSLSGYWVLPLPPGELLGDMYLELDRYEEALTAYEAVLERRPNRFNSLCGAARAAELGEEPDRARSHYQTLIDVAKDGDASRDCLRSGQAFLTTG